MSYSVFQSWLHEVSCHDFQTQCDDYMTWGQGSICMNHNNIGIHFFFNWFHCSWKCSFSSWYHELWSWHHEVQFISFHGFYSWIQWMISLNSLLLVSVNNSSHFFTSSHNIEIIPFTRQSSHTARHVSPSVYIRCLSVFHACYDYTNGKVLTMNNSRTESSRLTTASGCCRLRFVKNREL